MLGGVTRHMFNTWSIRGAPPPCKRALRYSSPFFLLTRAFIWMNFSSSLTRKNMSLSYWGSFLASVKGLWRLFELIVEVHCVSWNSYYNFYRFLVRITALTKYANIIFLFVNKKKKKYSLRLSHSTHSKKVSEVCIVFTLIEIEISPFSFDLNKLLY